MSKAEELLRELAAVEDTEPVRCTGSQIHKQWLARHEAAWNSVRAYLNEKPHDEAARKLYAEHTANGVYPAWSELEESAKDQYRRAASPPHAAAEPEKPMDDDLPGVLAVAKGVAEQKWPHTMDAAVWAREWIARTNDHPDVATDEGAMIGWFANAIMAGHDTAQARGGSYKEGWKDCVKAHDGLYPPHAEFQSPAETPLYASHSAQPIAREPMELTDDMLRYAMAAMGTGAWEDAERFRQFWKFATEAALKC